MVNRAGLIVLGCVLAAGPSGCADRRTGSTRLTAQDFADLSAEIASQLSASDAIQGRGPSSMPWVVSMDRVENLSGDFISVSEQWWLMEKVRSSVPMRSLGERFAIRFVIPAERLKEIRGAGPELADAGSARAPTHRMGAVIRSVARSGGGGRTDLYATDFELVGLADGAVVWSGRGEIKRVAFGRSWD